MKPEEFFEQRHPDYATNAELWTNLRTTYYGGKNFINKFLWPYEGEEADDVALRKKQAAYENHFQDTIERREAIVYSRNISRDVTKGSAQINQWQLIQEDADNRGSAWEKFIKKCFRMAQVYGYLPVLTDRPGAETTPTTRAQENANGLLPYALPILPTAMTNWEVDEGKLKWCVIRSVNTSRDPMAKEKKLVEYRLITDEVIQVWEETDKKSPTKVVLVDEVEHGVGRVPVVILNDLDPEEDSLVGLPSLHNSVDLSVLLFNVQSWHVQLLYKTNYSQLAATPWGGSGEDAKMKVGPNYALWVPEGGITPSWVSPPVGPSETFDKWAKDSRKRIYELAKLDAGLADDTARELSGEAYDRRHKPTEDEARRLGKRMEEFETEIADLLLNGWLKIDADVNITYPKRYGVRATADSLAQLKATEELKSLPHSVRSKLAAQIVFTEDFAELTDKEQDDLYDEIIDYDPLAIELAHQTALEQAKAAPQKDIESMKSDKELDKVRIDAAARVESEKARAEAEIKKAEVEANRPQKSEGILA